MASWRRFKRASFKVSAGFWKLVFWRRERAFSWALVKAVVK